MSAPARSALVLPRRAVHLGYAGLLPFVALAMAPWVAPAVYRAQFSFALLAYGATIASFLGAMHWGIAMREPLSRQAGLFVWGVIPSLVGWEAMLMPLSQGLAVLALLLGICFMVDRRRYPAYGLEEWLPMRLHLTLVAVVCLVVGSVTVW